MTNHEALLAIKVIAQNKLQEMEDLLQAGIALHRQLSNPDAAIKREMGRYPEELSVQRAQAAVEHIREVIVKYKVCLRRIDEKLSSITNEDSLWERGTFDEFGDNYAD